MQPRPPRSTLFPYTTLFRSRAERPQSTTRAESARLHCCIVPSMESPAAIPRTMYERGDRKSTRLNSSHSQISYAVFCLKKKHIQIECLMASQRVQHSVFCFL